MNPAIGDYMIAVQPSATDSSDGSTPTSPIGTEAAYLAAIAAIASIQQAIGNMQPQLAGAVQANGVRSAITVSDEAILITSDNIAMVGGVVFADWQMDVNGNAVGTVDPSVTKIRGGVIQTEKILSFDGNSWMNLDAVGSTAFIQCQSAVTIEANGNFTFGNGSGQYISWNGSTITVNGNIDTTGWFIGTGGTNNGIVTATISAQPSSSAVVGIYSQTTNAVAVEGVSTVTAVSGNSSGSTTSGVLGLTSSSTGYGVTAENSFGTPLQLIASTSAAPITVNSKIVISNLNSQYCNGFSFMGGATGTQSWAAIAANTCPGTVAATGAWAEIEDTSGNKYYFQVWN
jgi:hypothetical protein